MIWFNPNSGTGGNPQVLSAMSAEAAQALLLWPPRSLGTSEKL